MLVKNFIKSNNNREIAFVRSFYDGKLKKLPGVGDYTGNALLGFIYNYPTIAVDGNVKRVLARNLNKEEKK